MVSSTVPATARPPTPLHRAAAPWRRLCRQAAPTSSHKRIQQHAAGRSAATAAVQHDGAVRDDSAADAAAAVASPSFSSRQQQATPRLQPLAWDQEDHHADTAPGSSERQPQHDPRCREATAAASEAAELAALRAALADCGDSWQRLAQLQLGADKQPAPRCFREAAAEAARLVRRAALEVRRPAGSGGAGGGGGAGKGALAAVEVLFNPRRPPPRRRGSWKQQQQQEQQQAGLARDGAGDGAAAAMADAARLWRWTNSQLLSRCIRSEYERRARPSGAAAAAAAGATAAAAATAPAATSGSGGVDALTAAAVLQGAARMGWLRGRVGALTGRGEDAERQLLGSALTLYEQGLAAALQQQQEGRGGGGGVGDGADAAAAVGAAGAAGAGAGGAGQQARDALACPPAVVVALATAVHKLGAAPRRAPLAALQRRALLAALAERRGDDGLPRVGLAAVLGLLEAVVTCEAAAAAAAAAAASSSSQTAAPRPPPPPPPPLLDDDVLLAMCAAAQAHLRARPGRLLSVLMRLGRMDGGSSSGSGGSTAAAAAATTTTTTLAAFRGALFGATPPQLGAAQLLQRVEQRLFGGGGGGEGRLVRRGLSGRELVDVTMAVAQLPRQQQQQQQQQQQFQQEASPAADRVLSSMLLTAGVQLLQRTTRWVRNAAADGEPPAMRAGALRRAPLRPGLAGRWLEAFAAAQPRLRPDRRAALGEAVLDLLGEARDLVAASPGGGSDDDGSSSSRSGSNAAMIMSAWPPSAIGPLLRGAAGLGLPASIGVEPYWAAVQPLLLAGLQQARPADVAVALRLMARDGVRPDRAALDGQLLPAIARGFGGGGDTSGSSDSSSSSSGSSAATEPLTLQELVAVLGALARLNRAPRAPGWWDGWQDAFVAAARREGVLLLPPPLREGGDGDSGSCSGQHAGRGRLAPSVAVQALWAAGNRRLPLRPALLAALLRQLLEQLGEQQQQQQPLLTTREVVDLFVGLARLLPGDGGSGGGGGAQDDAVRRCLQAKSSGGGGDGGYAALCRLVLGRELRAREAANLVRCMGGIAAAAAAAAGSRDGDLSGEDDGDDDAAPPSLAQEEAVQRRPPQEQQQQHLQRRQQPPLLPPPEVVAWLLEQLRPQMRSQLRGRALTMTAWGVRKLGARPDDAWLEGFEAAALQETATMYPHELAIVVASLAHIGQLPPAPPAHAGSSISVGNGGGGGGSSSTTEGDAPQRRRRRRRPVPAALLAELTRRGPSATLSPGILADLSDALRGLEDEEEQQQQQQQQEEVEVEVEGKEGGGGGSGTVGIVGGSTGAAANNNNGSSSSSGGGTKASSASSSSSPAPTNGANSHRGSGSGIGSGSSSGSSDDLDALIDAARARIGASAEPRLWGSAAARRGRSSSRGGHRQQEQEEDEEEEDEEEEEDGEEEEELDPLVAARIRARLAEVDGLFAEGGGGGGGSSGARRRL